MAQVDFSLRVPKGRKPSCGNGIERRPTCLEAYPYRASGVRCPAFSLSMLFPLSASRCRRLRSQVRYKEGLIHGFLVLSTLDGIPIAEGDLIADRAWRSRHESSFSVSKTNRGKKKPPFFRSAAYFRLISYHLVQKGPAFSTCRRTICACVHGPGHGSLHGQ